MNITELLVPNREALIIGKRRTEALLITYLVNIASGLDYDYRGAIFCQSNARLQNLTCIAKVMITKHFPTAIYDEKQSIWTFKDGETLHLRCMTLLSDYWIYHGWKLPFIGFVDLTDWDTGECYLQMMSTLKSRNDECPVLCRSAVSKVTNTWIKERFINVGANYIDEYKGTRTFIDLAPENIHLIESCPDYVNRLTASQLGNYFK